MKHFILSLVLLTGVLNSTHAQVWSEPQVPGEDLNNLKSSEIVYLYNVKADAFMMYGMTSNNQACAARLTNGDYTATIPNQSYVFVSNGKVRIRNKERGGSYYLSCPTEQANDVVINKTTNAYFNYTETEEGSCVYTLNNVKFEKNLDVSWAYGGHLTLTDGMGYTTWAFIKERSVTNGSYALYKSKRLMYGIYKVLADAGKVETYNDALEEAAVAYTDANATVESITEAARRLFETVCVDITTPVDVSFMLDNADMVGSANTNGWYSGNPTFGWGEFEIYHATFTLEQDNSLPLGTYDLGFHSLYREDGSGTAPILTVVTNKGKYTGKTPLMGTIDYAVTNTTDNNWATVSGKIQPNGMQSCGQALAHGDAMAWVRDFTVDAVGDVNIKYTVNTNNQWVNWQGFRLYYKGLGKEELAANLKATIDEAILLYGDGSGVGADVLKAAIDVANGVYEDTEATNTSIKNNIDVLLEAMKVYRYGNASAENPIDKTSLIVNPSFEKQNEGWTVSSMVSQGNNVFKQKEGSLYLEKWTGRGGKVGDASVLQTVEELDMGVYQLVVGAQNIQEDTPSAAQNGAWIVANDSRKAVDKTEEYTLTFTNIERNVTIGFLAEGATGNWISVDNFRFYYIGGTDADYKVELQRYLDKTQGLTDSKMHTTALEALEHAITAAQTEIEKDNTQGYIKVSTPLREATIEAERSIAAYAALDAAIKKAEEQYGNGGKEGAEEYQAAIHVAQTAYENGATSYEELAHQIQLLDEAAFAFMIQSPTGAVPTITKTDKRYARGSVMAFGRFIYTLNGAVLREAGFCYSTEKNPTVLDQRSTKYLESNGRIYVMQDMQPATVYYARPYVVTEGYQVVYGDELKIITIPKANIGWSWNWGGSAEENERVSSAMRYGIEDIWGNLMSTQGFHLTGNYGSGTPTADCSYGGWMRVGPNASYQRTGTILHEAAHGVGVGTHWTWWTLLVNGAWTGPRANSVLQFWDNNTTANMAGDSQHMWPYGINGAHEDNGSEHLYYAQALIIQGFHEDGLSPTDGCFALPAYAFEHDDDVKYYLKNESSAYGLNTSYLTVEGSTLKWQEASSADIAADDAFAWYLSFDPKTQYYSLRNASTGQYITYSGSTFKTVSRETPTAADKFHFMKGRKDVKVGSGSSSINVRGYWILKSNGGSATAMVASADGTVASAGFDLSADAKAQHWVLLTAEETEMFDEIAHEAAIDQLEELIEGLTAVKATPHTEMAEGTDAALETALTDAAVIADDAGASLATIQEAIVNLRQAGMDFLSSVFTADVEHPFDITFLMADPGITTAEGWNMAKDVQSSCIEFYEQTFDFNQTIEGLSSGTYKLMVQGFNRPGETGEVYAAYQKGNNNAVAYLYAGTESTKLCHLAEYASTRKVHSDDLTMSSPKSYVPCTIASGAAYFKKGYYDNELFFELTKVTDLKLGIRQSTSASLYWTFFDNFRLYSYGRMSKDEATGMEVVKMEEKVLHDVNVYSIHGQKVGTTLEGLPRGIYIINKRKVIVK